MADFDSRIPTRTTALDSTVEVANASGVTINPAKEDGNLATIATNTPTVGQKTMSGSSPVVIASDQTTVPVSISGDQNVNIDKWGNTSTTLGQKTMSASVPVVLSSDQSSIPVSVSNTTTESFSYNTASAVASSASSTHSYTPASSSSIDEIDASASGQMKIEIQWGTTGAETTKAVFFTSKGDLSIRWRLTNPVTLTSSQTLKIIRTNMDNQAMDVYSTVQYH